MLWENLVGNSVGNSVGNFVGKSCGKILWEIVVGNFCGKSIREGGGGMTNGGDNMGGVANSFNYIRNSSCAL